MNQDVLPDLKRLPLSSILDALSDPIRLKIVKMLLEKGEVACGEFGIDMAKSTLSHHFKVLRDAGIIQKREEGTKKFNSLCKEELEARCPGLIDSLFKVKAPL